MSTDHRLKTLFYQSYDASSISQFLRSLSDLSENDRRNIPGFLGEGLHFQSFERPGRPLNLAVNIAKKSFLDRGDRSLAAWKEAIQLARSIDTSTLIPPMDVVTGYGALAIVMPKGKSPAKLSPKIIDSMLLDTARALSSAGLVLDDYPQVFQVEGVPFIVDWSDLAFQSKGY